MRLGGWYRLRWIRKVHLQRKPPRESGFFINGALRVGSPREYKTPPSGGIPGAGCRRLFSSRPARR